MRKTIPLTEFLALLKAQGVPKVNLAFKCPICHTVQSAHDLIAAGAGKTFADVERTIGFSCVGRFTKAGPYMREKQPPAKGCDWTLGGLLHMHELEVVDAEGKTHPHFEPATPEEAQRHAAENAPPPTPNDTTPTTAIH